MSKRFGRNQKRRLAQDLAQLQDINKAMIYVNGIQISAICRLESRLRDAEAVLGADNPAFHASSMEALGPAKCDPHATVMMRNGSLAHPMTMKLDDNPVLSHREQAHVFLTYKHHHWGYAITEQALRLYPREVLASHMAKAFTELALNELNRLVARR